MAQILDEAGTDPQQDYVTAVKTLRQAVPDLGRGAAVLPVGPLTTTLVP
ncbi:hypothetical protein [Streptomyces sp. NBC_01465]|nr:hypothetical protein [Streptomyces sp. NBC_01465]